MENSGNWNAEGDWDEREPPFTDEELQHALDWRQTHSKMTPTRRDCCPHPSPCNSVSDCVEKMAWYFRHRAVIHNREL